jgi:hypothetical protein
MTVHESPGVRGMRLDPRDRLRGLFEAVLGLMAAFWRHFGGALSVLSIVGFLAVMLAIDWLRPVHNWDTLAYLGVVARDWMGMVSPAEIHAYAYDTVRNAISPEVYGELTEMDAYRQRMAADPAAFVSMLGMYDVKWLYVALLALLGPVFGAYQAGFAINVGAAVLLSVSLIWWLRATRNLDFGFIAPALMMIAGISGFGMTDIPDFLAFSLTVSGVLLLDRQRTTMGLGLLFLAVLTRPDTIAFAGVLMAAAWFWRDRTTPKIAIAFFVSLAAYMFIKASGTHPGWWTHAWFSTYHMENTLEGFDPDFSLRVYLTGFGWNLVRGALENAWIGIYALTLMAWAVMQGVGLRMARHRTVLIASLMAGIAAKYAVFPIHDTRFYIALLFPAILLLFAGARESFRKVLNTAA